MDFYEAWELVKSKVPIANIDPAHIEKLNQLFNVTLPQYNIDIKKTFLIK